jgi:hypothetical protein
MPANKPMHPTAFGARDRAFFDAFLCSAPRRRVMGRAFGGSFSSYDENLIQ